MKKGSKGGGAVDSPKTSTLSEEVNFTTAVCVRKVNNIPTFMEVICGILTI